MGLNIAASNSGGDFDPYCKYNAKAGRWYAKIDGEEVEVMNPTFVADFDNIKTGWFYFRAGAAPEIVMDKDLSTPAPKPDRTYTDDKGKVRDCFKRGFDLRLFSKNSFGGVVVLNGASMHLNNAINELYDLYEQGKGANQGMLPVVSFTGSTPMKDKAGTNYRPNFSILKWVPRPAEFGETKQATPVAQNVNAPQVVQPAPVATQPQAESVSEF